MARVRKPAKRMFRDPHFWVTVNASMFCSLGEHPCGVGTRMRMRRGDVFRRASCAACLKARYGVEELKPTRPFTMSGDTGVDARAKRAGGDE
jgi:hypothetical protein